MFYVVNEIILLCLNLGSPPLHSLMSVPSLSWPDPLDSALCWCTKILHLTDRLKNTQNSGHCQWHSDPEYISQRSQDGHVPCIRSLQCLSWLECPESNCWRAELIVHPFHWQICTVQTTTQTKDWVITATNWDKSVISFITRYGTKKLTCFFQCTRVLASLLCREGQHMTVV